MRSREPTSLAKVLRESHNARLWSRTYQAQQRGWVTQCKRANNERVAGHRHDNGKQMRRKSGLKLAQTCEEVDYAGEVCRLPVMSGR